MRYDTPKTGAAENEAVEEGLVLDPEEPRSGQIAFPAPGVERTSAIDEDEAKLLSDELFEIHSHMHRHADGTIHNHYHRHAGGKAPHIHTEEPPKAGIVPIEDDPPAIGTMHEHASHVIPLHDHTVQPCDRAVLRAEGVSYAYPRTTEAVFSGIDIEAKSGSVLAILGNNGAGKSTLLNVLAGITKPDSGTVRIGKRTLASLSRRETAQHIAYVAQQQRIPHLSVYDQVLLGRRPHITWSLTDYDRTVVAKTIERLGLERFSSRYLDELSGGERQKVYIARALAQEPETLLLDEPTSALDPKNQMEVLRIIRDVTQAESIATILVIHDINLALRFCDRFLLVRDGDVVAYGDRSAVTGASLSATYDIDFAIEKVGGVPVAVPADDPIG